MPLKRLFFSITILYFAKEVHHLQFSFKFSDTDLEKAFVSRALGATTNVYTLYEFVNKNQNYNELLTIF